jgi:hypothetical protein
MGLLKSNQVSRRDWPSFRVFRVFRGEIFRTFATKADRVSFAAWLLRVFLNPDR